MNSTAAKELILKPTRQGMPIVGFGMWQVSKKDCPKVVETAIRTGYRLFDNACDYGNEAEVGDGLSKCFEKGLVKREEVFVTSKLWGTFHRKEHVREACLRSLTDLKLKYLDLYLIHFPIPMKYVSPETKYPPGWADDEEKFHGHDSVTIRETWEAMETLVDEGLVRNIGISNMNSSMIMDLLRYAKIRPSVLQIELHAYLNRKQLVEFAQREGIQVTSYSTLGPYSYISLGMSVKEGIVPLLQHPTVSKIAEHHERSVAQVLLRWVTQRGVAIIPKSQNAERITENFNILDFELSKDEMDTIFDLDIGLRFNDPGNYLDYPIWAN